MNLPTKLKAYRHMLNLTQDSIADALGIERSTYANYETGKKYPPSDVIQILAKLYSLPISFLSPPEERPSLDVSLVLSDVDLIPWEIPAKDSTAQEDTFDFASLSADEKMLVVRYRLKKAAEDRHGKIFDSDEIDRFIESFHTEL